MEDPNRKRRLAAWLPLAATSSHHKSSTSAQATAGSTSSAQPTTGSTSSAQAAGLRPFGLVGVGGVTPTAATGKLAVSGSIGDVLFTEDGTGLGSSATKVITTVAQDIRQHQ